MDKDQLEIVSKLHQDLAEARAENKGLTAQVKQLTGDLESERVKVGKEQEKVKALTTERDGFKAKLAEAPGEQAKEVERLQGEIRTRDHRDAWSVVRSQLHDKVTVDKLWAEIGYKPGDKLPTEEQIKEQMEAAREKAPYLFKPEEGKPDGETAPERQPETGPGPGFGRGASSKEVGTWKVRKSDTQDPTWMEKNQARLNEGLAEGRVKFID